MALLVPVTELKMISSKLIASPSELVAGNPRELLYAGQGIEEVEDTTPVPSFTPYLFGG